MKIKTKYNVKIITANLFGVLGYLLCCLHWVWAVILYFSEYKEMISLFLTSPKTGSSFIPEFTFTLPNSLVVIISVITVIFVLILTVYVLVKIPSSAVKTGKVIVHDTAKAIAPLALKTMHKRPTNKMRIQITAEIVALIKILLVLMPVILVFVFQFTGSKSIDYEVAQIVGYWLCVFSSVAFGTQYLIAKIMSVKKTSIW